MSPRHDCDSTLSPCWQLHRRIVLAGTVTRDVVDDMVLVSDEALVTSMRLMASVAGLMVEPAGVAGIAALLEHVELRSMSSATVVCGSNLTVEQIRNWLIDN